MSESKSWCVFFASNSNYRNRLRIGEEIYKHLYSTGWYRDPYNHYQFTISGSTTPQIAQTSRLVFKLLASFFLKKKQGRSEIMIMVHPPKTKARAIHMVHSCEIQTLPSQHLRLMSCATCKNPCKCGCSGNPHKSQYANF